MGDDLVKAPPLPFGNGRRRVHRLCADAPGRDVDDAPQPQVVRRIVKDAEIGQHVLDLRPVEEADAAEDFIGDAVTLEGVLHGVGLGVHPVEDGIVLPAAPHADPRQHLRCHILGLVVLVHGGVALNPLPRSRLCPQLLALAAAVVADDCVGGIQNGLGGAVVLLQTNHSRPFVLLLKGEDVFDRRPPEAVDGLVVVAHHTDVFPLPRQRGGQQILQVVGVLILINEDIAELVLPILPHLA